jgi:hypothetical protein
LEIALALAGLHALLVAQGCGRERGGGPTSVGKDRMKTWC